MKILVNCKPGSSVNKVQETNPGTFTVWLSSKPIGGKANEALIEVLAQHFQIKKHLITIKSGLSSRTKIVLVDL